MRGTWLRTARSRREGVESLHRTGAGATASPVPDGKGTRMRRAILLFTAMGVVLLLASGEAFAAITCGGGYCQGNNNDNKIYGTSGPDEIYGRGGGDTIYGREGRDSIRGDWHQWLDPGEPGNDTIYGGYGSDYLYGDERTDTLKGDPGNDYIHAEMDGEL